jgi:hypothetical protein
MKRSILGLERNSAFLGENDDKVFSGLQTNHPQCPSSTVLLYPQRRHPEPQAKALRLPLSVSSGVTSELAIIRPQHPSGTILLYPKRCHPERSEGSAVVLRVSE